MTYNGGLIAEFVYDALGRETTRTQGAMESPVRVNPMRFQVQYFDNELGCTTIR